MDTSDAGFSLVEVLVALTVSALLMAAAYGGLALATRGMRVSDAEARQLEVARDQLARVGIETPLVQGERTGKSGNVVWTVSVRPYLSPADPAGEFGKPRAFWIEVEARAPGRPTKRLTTLKLEGLGK